MSYISICSLFVENPVMGPWGFGGIENVDLCCVLCNKFSQRSGMGCKPKGFALPDQFEEGSGGFFCRQPYLNKTISWVFT